MPETGAKHLHVELSAESRAGWSHLAARNGVTIASMVEAVGLILGAQPGMPPQLEAELVAIARQVSAERRARRRS